MAKKMAGTKTRNLPDSMTLEDFDDSIRRYLVVDLTTQFRGNRVTSRFYPDHYARVVYAKALIQHYRMDG